MTWAAVAIGGSAVIGAGASMMGSRSANKAQAREARRMRDFQREQLAAGIGESRALDAEGLGYIDPFYQSGLSGLDKFQQQSLDNPYLNAQGGLAGQFGLMNPNIGYGQLPNAQIGNQFNAGQVGVSREDIMNDPSFGLMRDMGLENSAKLASRMGMRNSSSRLGADNQAIRDATLATRDRIGQDQRFNIGQDWQAQQANYGRDADTYGNQMNQALLGYQADVGNYNRQAGQLGQQFDMQGQMGATQMGLLGNLTGIGLQTGGNIMNAFNNRATNQMNARMGQASQASQLAQTQMNNYSNGWAGAGQAIQGGIEAYQNQRMFDQYMASRQPMNQPNVGPQLPGGY